MYINKYKYIYIIKVNIVYYASHVCVYSGIIYEDNTPSELECIQIFCIKNKQI